MYLVYKLIFHKKFCYDIEILFIPLNEAKLRLKDTDRVVFKIKLVVYFYIVVFND